MTRKHKSAFIAVLLLSTIDGFAQDTTNSHNTPKRKTQAVHDVKVTYGPSVQSLTDTTAFITWSTNVSANTVLRYGTKPDALDQVAQSPSGGTTHSVHLKDLTPETTYYYRVGSVAPQTTEPMSGPASFKTKPAKPSQ